MTVMTTAAGDSPGFEPVAAEHKVQIELLTALRRALEQGRERALVEGILEQLVSYTNAHFMSEQLLMRLYAYPYFESHDQDHDRLMEQVQDLQARYRGGDVDLTLQAGATLRDGLIDHIEGLDRGLEDYLLRHARQAAAPGEYP